jgi:ATP-dependent Lhr-like helicase
MILIKEYMPERDNVIENIAGEIFSKLRGSNNLVFTNRRVDAESYAVLLGDMCEEANVPNEFRVHHGSLSKEERESVEHELQKGETPVTALCTSTLELGVDIGKVKSIAQIGVANSSALYGSFAFFPILLAWVYISWQIILLGSVLSCQLQSIYSSSEV